MIGYLEGRIHSLTTERVIVLAGGVGYMVQIPLSTYYRLEGSPTAALQIHTHVREDALALYGFSSVEEKFAFEKLISISGIGPRLAQVILSGIDVTDLAEAIVRSDTRRLSSIPGVGKKTSERICLELRDKLILPEATEPRASAPRRTSIDDDVVSALQNLGYKSNFAENAIKTARGQLGETPEFSDLLKAALRQLTK
ncbi:MAG TPA: Holliday junction branch migration protein RuvA [Thermoanaerobaculia bacterium]|nr:Holliday junction branch migration protein RuvA [Thermoanaerobaculia bacterium]